MMEKKEGTGSSKEEAEKLQLEGWLLTGCYHTKRYMNVNSPNYGKPGKIYQFKNRIKL